MYSGSRDDLERSLLVTSSAIRVFHVCTELDPKHLFVKVTLNYLIVKRILHGYLFLTQPYCASATWS